MIPTNQLLVGIKGAEGSIIREFSLRKLSAQDLKEINNIQYRVDHPFQWLIKTVSTVLETLGGEIIGELYRRSKKVPEIVKNLTILDASQILVAAHIISLGGDVNDYERDCPCGQARVGFTFDLENDIIPPELGEIDPATIVDIELRDGFTINLPNIKDLGLDGVLFTRYQFRLPVLADVLKHEQHFSNSSRSTFSEKIMATCLVGAQSEDGTEMPDSFRVMLSQKLILDLSAYDLKLINRRWNEVMPAYRLEVFTECSRCGREVKLPVEPNFLFAAV